MIRELYRGEYAIVTREPGFVRLRRMNVPIPVDNAANIADDLVEQFRLAVPLRERRGWGLLMDMRDAPLMVNEDTRDTTRRLTDEMTREFSRVAILVKTALGKLQATRTLREDASAGRHSTSRVFDDEQAAITYLRTDDPMIPPPRSSRF